MIRINKINTEVRYKIWYDYQKNYQYTIIIIHINLIVYLPPSLQSWFQSRIISHHSFREVFGADTMAPMKDRAQTTQDKFQLLCI